jgi:hypothetical protein
MARELFRSSRRKTFFDYFVTGWRAGWKLTRPRDGPGWSIRVPGSTLRSGLRNPFVSEADRELRETKALCDETRRAFEVSPYAAEDAADEFTFNIVMEACERAAIIPTHTLVRALFQTTRGLLIEEGSLFGFPDVDFSRGLSLEEGVRLRTYLRRKRQFLDDRARLEDIWREKVIRIFEGIIGYLPSSVFLDDVAAIDKDDPAGSFQAAVIDLCDEPAMAIERTAATLLDDDVVSAQLFNEVREQIDRNHLLASGIPLERSRETSKQIVLPTEARGQSSIELVRNYLGGTPFADLFSAPLPFAIPFPARFEHTLIVGGTGHGKTQLMQLLIHDDLLKAQDDGRSIIVIDSQGDLIRTIAHLAYFSPTADKSLAERLVIVDPTGTATARLR